MAQLVPLLIAFANISSKLKDFSLFSVGFLLIKINFYLKIVWGRSFRVF